LTIKYLILFKNNCEKNISFKELEYNYKKTTSRSGGKWTLSLWQNNKRIATVKEDEYGFSKDKLDFLVEKLSELD
jgi:hypothetical protein